MATTLLHRLEAWAKEAPDAIAQSVKKGGSWQALTAREYWERVAAVALYLDSKGFGKGHVGAILSYNCPEWVHLDLAFLLTGGKSAGLYPNSTPKDIRYILDQTECAALCVQNREYYQKLGVPDGERLPGKVGLIIGFEPDTAYSNLAVPYERVLAEGLRLLASPSGQARVEAWLRALDPTAASFMIYTSGTTGNPKGALLSQDNLCFTSDVVASYWRLPEEGSLFSFLPLCHIAEKIQNLGVGISRRYKVTFASRFENVSAELPEVEPTLLLCVPRLWEKMMEGVISKVASGKGAKKALAQWALRVGARVAAARFGRRKVPNPLDLLQLPVADRLVLSSIRRALGLRRADVLASGAAALPAHVSRWFRSLGLEILEDFGQTESTGVICMTEPGVESSGTVGKPVPGMEVRLADDGEILTRGRHVFVGYFKDASATQAALEGGWLHTGDLGSYDSRGLMRIQGRKKELLKTSGGKMVAPLPIEEELKAAPIISQVCMVGEGRKYLAALITLSEPKLAELKSKGELPAGLLITSADVLKEVKGHVDALNERLASYEQIKRFAVLSREFSVADGEMTPTLKMKRNVIEQRFSDVIDQMYVAS